jgi:hypothetical protein
MKQKVKEKLKLKKKAKKVKKTKRHSRLLSKKKKWDQWDNFKSFQSTVRTDCHIEEQKMNRDFVIVNQQKVKYCVGIHDSFIDMNLKLFFSYLPAIKNSLVRMVSMKGTLYCSLCDAHKQHFFSIKDKEIVLQKNFCRTLLKEEVDYFMFMHVVYIEFIDQLLQYLACFETDAHVFSFPYPSFMVRYRRRIKYVKHCLSSINDEKNFFKNCYMICRQFSLTKFSSFFEGDLELFKRVNVSLHSFMRKYRRGEKIQEDLNKKELQMYGTKVKGHKELIRQISVPENVDGELLEPFGPHSGVTDKNFYFEEEDRLAHFGDKNTVKYSYGVDIQNPKEVKKIKDALKKEKAAELKRQKEKLKESMQRLKDAQKGIYVAPKKPKFKLPLKGHVIGPSGLVDRLSNRYFKEHLHKGFYPLRGHHKFTNNHWKFKKHAVEYGLLGKGVDKKKKPTKTDAKNGKKDDKKKTTPKPKTRILAVSQTTDKNKPADKKDDKVDTKIKDVVKDSQKTAEELKKKKEEEEKKKKEEEEMMKNLKPNYNIEDQINGDLKHKNYEDVVSRPNDHIEWKPTGLGKKLDDTGGDVRHQVFDKSEATIKIKNFVYEFEEEGINPLYDLDHLNYKIDVTTLIQKRFEMSEKLNREVLHLYLKANNEFVKDFNEQIHDMKVDDFETINEKLKEVKDLKKVQKELVKTGDEPVKLTQITTLIAKKEKEINENEARRKISDKVAAIKRQKRKKGDSDLNYDKHPDHHDHLDMYFHDSFNGIQHHFQSIFGS